MCEIKTAIHTYYNYLIKLTEPNQLALSKIITDNNYMWINKAVTQNLGSSLQNHYCFMMFINQGYITLTSKLFLLGKSQKHLGNPSFQLCSFCVPMHLICSKQFY